jgi:hypothetical protein
VLVGSSRCCCAAFLSTFCHPGKVESESHPSLAVRVLAVEVVFVGQGASCKDRVPVSTEQGSLMEVWEVQSVGTRDLGEDKTLAAGRDAEDTGGDHRSSLEVEAALPVVLADRGDDDLSMAAVQGHPSYDRTLPFRQGSGGWLVDPKDFVLL